MARELINCRTCAEKVFFTKNCLLLRRASCSAESNNCKKVISTKETSEEYIKTKLENKEITCFDINNQEQLTRVYLKE